MLAYRWGSKQIALGVEPSKIFYPDLETGKANLCTPPSSSHVPSNINYLSMAFHASKPPPDAFLYIGALMTVVKVSGLGQIGLSSV